MSKLLAAYDAYNEFERHSYFTLCYDAIPSDIYFSSASMDEKKENMEAVIDTLQSTKVDFQVIFKNWEAENEKGAESAKNYPRKYLLKSTSLKVMLWVTLDSGLYIEILYDVAEVAAEKWALSMHQTLKDKFGEDKAPTFNVLSRDERCFYTEDVKTENFTIDVDKYYNDDFQAVDTTIKTALSQERSGLILLHGTPGTGKTSYIKSLITHFDQQSFIFVQNEFVNMLLHPEFISFLLQNKNSVLIIEDAEKVITTREYANESSVVSTILQLTDGLFSDYLNIKIICTFNTSIEKIDQALLRKGRMIAYYDFKPLSKTKTTALMSDLNHSVQDSEMTLADIFNYQSKGFEDVNASKKVGF